VTAGRMLVVVTLTVVVVDAVSVGLLVVDV
jgi:hypothetical protein